MYPTFQDMLAVISCVLSAKVSPELLRRLRIQVLNGSSVITFSPRIEQLATPVKDELLRQNFAGVRTSDIWDQDTREKLENATIGGINNLDMMLRLSKVQTLVNDFKANPTLDKA